MSKVGPDTTPLGTNARIDASLISVRDDLRWPYHRAVTTVALSGPEASYESIASRKMAYLSTQNACAPRRSIIGIEPNRGASGSVDMAQNRDGKWVPQLNRRIRTDAAATSFLRDNGWAFEYGPSKVLSWFKPYTESRHEMAAFYEWIIDKRKGALLWGVSIGPTMMSMGASFPAQVAAGLAKPGDAPKAFYKSWPDDWDEVYQMWMAQTPAQAFKWVGYLNPAWPSRNPDDIDAGYKWVLNQTGAEPNRFVEVKDSNGDIEKIHYPKWYYQYVMRPAIKQVLSRAAAIGYPTTP